MSERISVSVDGGSLSTEQIDGNFNDVHPPLTAAQAMAESARCLYCFDAPCIKSCPTSIDIPKFIHQIRTGNIAGSARTILSSNIMGGTCARVCPTEILCEGSCVMNAAGERPIMIGRLQRHAVDGFLAMDRVHPFRRVPSTGKRIAVAGAGPAGLACAHRAAMLGHEVTVFEARPKPGGLNEYGLAAYKMTGDFARAEVEFLLAVGGITVEYGKAFGRNLSLDDLRKGYDAVFLAVGLGDVNALGVPGEEFAGVKDAIEFIEELRQTEPKSVIKVPDRIVVIGGGNTAIDAAVQAKRLGAKDVILAYRRGPEQMPATEWEQDLAKTNNVRVIYWAKPVRIIGSKRVESVSFEYTRLVDGKLTGTGKTFSLPVEMVLKAIGQVLHEGALSGIELDRRKIKVDERYRTGLPGVFAGGDCIDTGEDLTVQAVDDGTKAAESIDAYLKEGK